MATIAENLQTLQDTKIAIKTAIEGKGQDLTNVPFTEYANKIEAIEGGGVDKAAVIKEIIEARGGNAVRLFYAEVGDGFTTLTNDDLAQLIKEDTLENATRLESTFENCIYITDFPFSKTGKAHKWNGTFNNCIAATSFPLYDTSSATYFSGVWQMCTKLTMLGDYDLRKVTQATYTCFNCSSLVYIGKWDLRSCTSFQQIVGSCSKLEEVWFKNIKASLQVGSGTSWGHLLKQECLIHLIYQLRDTGSAKTLTIGSANLAKITNVYVRPFTADEIEDAKTNGFTLYEWEDEEGNIQKVEIEADADEADRQLTDEKKPFVVCTEDTEGAIPIIEYALQKNWQIAG